ncbi:MAG TPA: thiamine pyrophosphate-binding protein [Candidatus Methylacidiphilales bacterium]|jgi:acetolactate synthase-1/2/3 large subunit|nr:thiamine pyrophosphate-binding protein [Candidatus Methylacidiphilales bacterium]
MMRLADYVVQQLVAHGVHHVFLVTGGGAMHLNDAIAREPRLRYFCNHHEQAGAMAAEGYARVAGAVGVLNVTAGPGGVNALNGVFGAFTDSVPMLILSGQAKRETLFASYDLPHLRQLGDQEVDIIHAAGKMTKYAKLILDPNTIRYELEKALHLATSGRPGPCWLDIPVDVQSAQIDPEKLAGYEPEKERPVYLPENVGAIAGEVLEKIRAAERPVLLVGTGVRIAGALDLLEEIAAVLKIPVATAWTPDLLPTDNPYYCGRQGSIGTRAGNFTVQNADFVLILGARMGIRQVSYNWKSFARHAYKFQVDVDPAELNKPISVADRGVCCEAKYFLEELKLQLAGHAAPERHTKWLGWCRERVAGYPPVLARQRTWKGGINPYYFVETLFDQLGSEDVVVCGDATACIVPFQAAKLRKGQRLFSNSGSASMGYDLPAAIGAAVAHGKRTICLGGDGSIMMNLQELQTVAHHRLPLVIFVLNNGGYLSIRTTQSNFFGQLIGEGAESGVSFPDFVKVAEAHGLRAMKIEGEHFAEQIAEALRSSGPVLCEVMLDRAQGFEPKLSSKKLPDGRMVTAPLEDMAPFLPRDEFKRNLLIPPWEES